MFEQRQFSFFGANNYNALAFIFKILESILCSCGIILLADYTTGFYNNRIHDLSVVACGGFLISSTSFLIVYLLDSRNHYLEVVHLLTGATINILSGAFSFYHYIDTEHSEFGFYGLRTKKTYCIGITMTVCGVVMLLDFTREMYEYHTKQKHMYN